jgi:hypothetical protein
VRGDAALPRAAANKDTALTGIARQLPYTRRARTPPPRDRSTSSHLRIHKAARRWPGGASKPPRVVSVSPAAATLRKARTHGDQSDTAMRAKDGLLTSRRRVPVFGTCHDGLPGIHRPAALGTIANGRITASMVEIWTGRGYRHSHSILHACGRAVGRRLHTHITPVQTGYPCVCSKAVSKCTRAVS